MSLCKAEVAICEDREDKSERVNQRFDFGLVVMLSLRWLLNVQVEMLQRKLEYGVQG